jgi:exodeoxyribonuclease VII small subunit
MSTKNNQTLSEKLEKLDELVAWFDQEDFSIEEALEKFKQADKLASEIEQQLNGLKNEITVLAKRFDQEEN